MAALANLRSNVAYQISGSTISTGSIFTTVGNVPTWSNQLTYSTLTGSTVSTNSLALASTLTGSSIILSGNVGVATITNGLGDLTLGYGSSGWNTLKTRNQDGQPYPTATYGDTSCSFGWNSSGNNGEYSFLNNYGTANSLTGGFAFFNRTGAASKTELMRINSIGLGIGTAVPTNLLTVQSGVLEVNDGTTTGKFGIYSFENIFLINPRTSTGGAGNYFGLTMKSNGNVGIGTGNPKALFHINALYGNSVFSPVLGATTNSIFLLTSDTSGYGLNIVGSNTGAIHFQSQYFDGNTNPLSLTLNPMGGNVAIGTTNPYTPVHFVIPSSASSGGGNIFTIATKGGAEAGQRIYIGNYDTGAAPGSASYSFINSSYFGSAYNNLCLQSVGGYVGIGITNPATTLHVNGTVAASTFLTTVGVFGVFNTTNERSIGGVTAPAIYLFSLTTTAVVMTSGTNAQAIIYVSINQAGVITQNVLVSNGIRINSYSAGFLSFNVGYSGGVELSQGADVTVSLTRFL